MNFFSLPVYTTLPNWTLHSLVNPQIYRLNDLHLTRNKQTEDEEWRIATKTDRQTVTMANWLETH